MPKSTPDDGQSRTLRNALVTGVILSGVWLCISAVLIYRWGEFPNLRLNEVGDFLAGAVAPLAFLWIVVTVFLQTVELGYQRQEMRQSRVALEQQAGETAALVEQSRLSAEAARDSLRRQQHADSEERLHKLLDSIADKIIHLAGRLIAVDRVPRSPRVFYFFSDRTTLVNLKNERGLDAVFESAEQGMRTFVTRVGKVEHQLSGSGSLGREQLPKLETAIAQLVKRAAEGEHETVQMRIDVIDLPGFLKTLKDASELYVARVEGS